MKLLIQTLRYWHFSGQRIPEEKIFLEDIFLTCFVPDLKDGPLSASQIAVS